MTAIPAAAIAVPAATLNNTTTHVFCCNPDQALCGHDIRDAPEVPDGTGHDCIVCLDLEYQPCPHCGYQPEETTP